MKSGWQHKNLGELCDVLDHKRKPITKRDREAGQYPYYGATGILDHVAGYLFDEPLVLVGEDGAKWASGERSAFAVDGKIWVNNHAHVLKPDRNQLLDKWLIYYLNHSDLTEFVSGLTVPKLNQGSLREIPIPVPPLPEQQRIVGILDQAFEAIATTKANTEKNLQNARAIFESYLKSVLTQRSNDWVETTIGDCFKVRSGDFLPARKMVASGEYRVYGGNGISGRHDQKNLTGETIIIGRVGAKCGNVHYVEGDAWVTDNALYIAEYLRPLDARYLTRLLRLKDLRRRANQMAQPVISYTTIKDLPLEFPASKVEQERIARSLDNMEDQTLRLCSVYMRKIGTLDALKKSILHQAFTGQL